MTPAGQQQFGKRGGPIAPMSKHWGGSGPGR
jgi:hypothetical protein